MVKKFQSKTDKVRELVALKDYKSALKIAKDFRLGISVEDIVNMRRGYECITNPRFYMQIGYDVTKETQKGIDTAIRLFGTAENI